jgi:protein SYS1
MSCVAGMVMDWRQMAGRPTTTSTDPWTTLNSVWSGGKQVGIGGAEDHWNTKIDWRRGWVIAVCWIGASFAE